MDVATSARDKAAVLRFSKGQVYVHPSLDARENIPGFLSIIQQVDGSILLAWTPDCLVEEPYVALQRTNAPGAAPGHAVPVDLSLSDMANGVSTSWVEAPPSAATTYAMRIPLERVYSLRKFIPTLGISFLIITGRNDESFPPLHFHDGYRGIHEFVQALGNYAAVTKSNDDPNVYLVNDDRMHLTRSLHQLQISTPAPPAATPPSSSEPPTPAAASVAAAPASSAGGPPLAKTTDDTLGQTLRDASWNVLEGLSQVTRFARERTSRLFEPVATPAAGQARPLPAAHQKILADYGTLPEAPRHEAPSSLGAFEIVPNAEASMTPAAVDRRPLTVDQWLASFDAAGHIRGQPELRRIIFYGGMEPELRREVWKYLLNYLPFNATHAERDDLIAAKRSAYYTVKRQWQSILPEQEAFFSKFRDRRSRIEKDVVRTDRSEPIFQDEAGKDMNKMREILLTYTFYNFDLGYVQGMADLLAPILSIMDEEVDTFWCFVGFMERMRDHFDKDQHGMHRELLNLRILLRAADPPFYEYLEGKESLNLFFCFRWLLVLFKREFSFLTIQRLWESLWAGYLSPNFHLCLCIAILQAHKTILMSHAIASAMAFDDILKYINDLSMSIPLKESLQHAEYVYFQLVRLSEQQPEVAAVLAGLEPSATALATETAANAIRAHATTSGPATASSVAAPGRPPPASSA